MIRLVLNLYFLLLFLPAFSQRSRCAADFQMMKNAALHDAVNKKIQEINSSKLRLSAEVLRIPVVVHIIHNNTTGLIGGTGNSNISDEQVFSQIEVLNQDYRRVAGTLGYNNNPVGADMQIEFFLANIDPNGSPSNGINRVYSSRRSYDIRSETLALSNLSYWDSNKYLNIWVTTVSGGYLGIAEFPIGDYDGLELTDIDERIDGVYIDYRAFGVGFPVVEAPYDHGRTTTHEVGHWLGLIHTWGDAFCGTDFCEDTPPTERSNNSFVCTPVYSSCNGIRTQNMIENFLDYTVDSCMNIFTQDQKDRVRAILDISQRRKNLINNSDIFVQTSEPLIVKVYGNPVEGNYINCKVLVNQAKDFNVRIIDNLGRELYHEQFSNSLSRSVQIPKNKVGKGVLHLIVSTSEEQIKQRVISL